MYSQRFADQPLLLILGAASVKTLTLTDNIYINIEKRTFVCSPVTSFALGHFWSIPTFVTLKVGAYREFCVEIHKYLHNA